jgi:cell wall assembly regulator SMI1
LEKHAPRVYASLAPGASSQAFDDAERAIGRELPLDVRQAYLRHDGNPRDREVEQLDFFPPGLRFSSLSQLVEDWTMAVDEYRLLRADPDTDCIFPEPDESWNTLRVRPVYYDLAWIPIGYASCFSTFVDLNPAPAGRCGQLIWHMGSEGVWFADSLNAYLEKLIEATESGKIKHAGRWVWADSGESILDWTPLWH